jgi:lysophospholipase L1-like esterase
MKVLSVGRGVLGAVVIAASALVWGGCEPFGGGGGGGGLGSGHDFGDNDPNVIAALGDSITAGGIPAGVTPYPPMLASMTGKRVVNAGVGGQTAGQARGRVGGLLSKYKPGYLVILLGSNDAIDDLSTADTIAALRAIIQAAKANKTIPVLCTLPPVTGPHGAYSGGVDSRNRAIPQLGSEEGVKVVKPGVGVGDLSSDGLHPLQSGQDKIAKAFANAF